jgi:gliding motility-associated-like protein
MIMRLKKSIVIVFLLAVSNVNSQCNSWIQQDFDSFEYTTVCPYIIPGTTYQNSPQGTGFGPSYTGTRHIYLNFQNGYLGPAFDRPYTVCIGQTYRISFYHRDAWGGQNNTTFNIYDANNVLVSSAIVPWTGSAWNNFVSPALTATTSTLRLEIVNNSSTIGNNDMVVDDMQIEMCGISETVSYTFCGTANSIDLFSLFSSNMPVNGTWSGPTTLSNGNSGTFNPLNNAPGVYEYQLPNSGFCNQPPSQVTVDVAGVIDLGADTTICAGSSITLTADPGFDAYLWSNGATTQSISVNQAGVYSVEGSFQSGNVITNGDFSAGNTGFNTDYTLGTGGPWGLLSNPNTYAISTSPSNVHNNFQPCGDHTTGTGNMMIVNGASTPNSNVWCQTVNVSPNTDYSFSCWISNALFDPNVAILQFYVNGGPIGNTFSTAVAGCTWNQYADTWNSGGLTSANICIINQNTSGGGNDFVIDDIVFSTLCTSSDSITVSVEVTTQSISSVDPFCFNGTDGEIHVDNAMAIDYSNDGGITWQSDSFFVNQSIGAYSVCSRTQLGCVLCQNVVINNPAQMTINVSNDEIICENGTAVMSAWTNGVNGITFHWDHTADTLGIQSVEPTVNTSYSVYAENEFGCTSSIETINVTLNPPISGNITSLQTICAGESVTITASASGGMGAPFTFTWSTTEVGVSNTNHTITVSPTDSIDFTVTITDGCESTPLVITTRINVGQIPQPQFVVINPYQCEPAVFEIVNATDPTQSETVSWIVDGNQYFGNSNVITTDTLYAGDYNVSLTVTSYEGCVGTLDSIEALNVNPIPVANFSYSPNPVMMFNPQVLFSNTSVNAIDYQWYFEDANILESNLENPNVNFPEGIVNDYNVTLIAISEYGCTDTIHQLVKVNPEVILYAPNTFTPDGDEFNQTFRVFMEGIDIYKFEMLIFNRWGETVYESMDINQGWDGTYNGKSVHEGTYVWRIVAKDFFNDSKYIYTGHVNLIK